MCVRVCACVCVCVCVCVLGGEEEGKAALNDKEHIRVVFGICCEPHCHNRTLTLTVVLGRLILQARERKVHFINK